MGLSAIVQKRWNYCNILRDDGLAGTLILGIYPKPFFDYTVAATTIFSAMGAPVTALLP